MLKKCQKKINYSVCLIALMLTLSVTTAWAGPALSFIYDYTRLNQAQCMRKGTDVLIHEHLLPPQNSYRLNNAVFVAGENSKITVIIDCSEIHNRGRVTVMVAHPSNLNITRRLSTRILKRMKSPGR